MEKSCFTKHTILHILRNPYGWSQEAQRAVRHAAVDLIEDLVEKPEEEKIYENIWDDHKDYPREDWQYEVSNGDTNRGYWDWVRSMLERDADEKAFDGRSEQ